MKHHTQTQTHRHTDRHTDRHTQTHTDTHTYTNTHTHTHIHTYTHYYIHTQPYVEIKFNIVHSLCSHGRTAKSMWTARPKLVSTLMGPAAPGHKPHTHTPFSNIFTRRTHSYSAEHRAHRSDAKAIYTRGPPCEHPLPRTAIEQEALHNYTRHIHHPRAG
jgi:hypothetical protein